jgi:DNA-binding HxlR family transcriptional regulator
MTTDTMTLKGPLADRDSWEATECSIARALDIVGTRSAMMLLREAYYGAHRFDDLARRAGITEAIAAKRLRELEDAGLFARRPYRDPGQRTRDEYVLTERGRDLFPALVSLMSWGDRYLAERQGPPIQLTHSGCGAPLQASVRCTAGHEVSVEAATAEFSPARLARRPRRKPSTRD